MVGRGIREEWWGGGRKEWWEWIRAEWWGGVIGDKGGMVGG
jgi:hypothetical protein